MKATKKELMDRYIPALIELSKLETITGKIAYACSRSIEACNSALKDIESSRTMLLTSRAVKLEDGKTPKTARTMKLDGANEDGTPKMIPANHENGQPMMEYVYENEDKKSEATSAVLELEANPIEVSVHKVKASEIILLPSMKNGGIILYNLGDIIDHEK